MPRAILPMFCHVLNSAVTNRSVFDGGIWRTWFSLKATVEVTNKQTQVCDSMGFNWRVQNAFKTNKETLYLFICTVSITRGARFVVCLKKCSAFGSVVIYEVKDNSSGLVTLDVILLCLSCEFPCSWSSHRHYW